ncbi:MAG: glycosyltransferase [Actinomycetota bacterium]|nr:glycosyltransferase [Actinomycetota bacterium]
MKVLLSAYSCEVGKGSEPEVGLQTLLAAASQHEVWLLTTEIGLRKLKRYLARSSLADRIHVEAVPLGVREHGLSLVAFHRYYDRWQRRVSTRVLDLDRVVNFDVIHHATLASYWTRAGVAVVDKPFVWGPVGGGVLPPMVLVGELGGRGFLGDLARMVGRKGAAALPPVRRAARRADVILAQNEATARVLHPFGHVEIVSNATAAKAWSTPPIDQRRPEVVIAGRLVAWKAVPLALRAWGYVTHPRAELIIYGDGPDRSRIEREIRRRGWQDRVRIAGWIPREHLLERVGRAAAVLHTSLHDEAGLALSEALSLGTPVVCLDHGGPREIVRQWPQELSVSVPPGPPDLTARRLAAGIDRFLASPAPVRTTPLPPRRSYTEAILTAYEEAVRSYRSNRVQGRSAHRAR